MQSAASAGFSPGVIVSIVAVSLSALSTLFGVIIFAARITPALTTLTKVVDDLCSRQDDLEAQHTAHGERLTTIEAERRVEQRRSGLDRRHAVRDE